ncbi:MAG TPA: hypothetical protein VNP89_01175 [Gaiellaceae bacterium]|nr:hypothetical protein [Gaiellaceae bacterium]
MLGVTAAAAAPPAGRLDPSFGRDGVVVHRLTGGYDVARGLAALPTGDVIVAAESGGYLKPFAGPDAVLLRLRPSGVRDRRFGTNGVLRVDVGRGVDRVSGVARLEDGRIAAGGAAHNLNGDAYGDDAALYAFRALPSGTLDPSFGRKGVASVRVGGTLTNALSGIAVSPDGGIVVGGTTDPKRLTLARFDARGRPDRHFGGDGLVSHRLQYPYALTRQPDGRLLVVGMTNLPLRDWFVLRLRADGTRDPTFGGGDGLVVTSFGRGPDAALAVVVDRRGRILVTGTSQAGVECTALCRQLRLVRYLPSGRVDASFARSSRMTAPVDPAYDALGLALQREGGILVAGSALVAGQAHDPELALWRFDPSGLRDLSFGVRGVLATNPTSGRLNLDFLTNAIVQPDGRILASGGSSKPRTGFDSGSLSDVAVLRAR